MIESIILLLIYVLVLALVIWLVLWVLQSAGVSLPPQAIKIVWAIFALIVILMLARLLLGSGAWFDMRLR